MIRQFTATIYVIKKQSVLLIHHKKHDKWVPPGGHLLPYELPIDAAIREAKEETGLDILPLKQENVWVEPLEEGRSFERPYMCLLEKIPAHGSEPPHEHIDFIYVGTPVGGMEIENLNEIHQMKWLNISEIKELHRKKALFPDALTTIEKILDDFLHLV